MTEQKTEMTAVELYLEWLNDYLSVEGFAEAHCMSEQNARRLISAGRTIHRMATERPKLLQVLEDVTNLAHTMFMQRPYPKGVDSWPIDAAEETIARLRAETRGDNQDD